MSVWPALQSGRTRIQMLEDLRISDFPADGQTHVIEVEGQVDLYSAPEFKERTTRVIASGVKRVVIDLSGVGFMDSSGLGVLVGALKRLRASRAELLLVVTNYDVERVLQAAGLEGTFSIYRSRDEAVNPLSPRGC